MTDASVASVTPVDEDDPVSTQTAYGVVPEGVRPPWPVDIWWGLLQNRARWIAETGSGKEKRRIIIDSETRSLLRVARHTLGVFVRRRRLVRGWSRWPVMVQGYFPETRPVGLPSGSQSGFFLQ